MFGPGPHTESATLAGYVKQQLDGIKAAAFGLTDEQARATPCRSALSVGGLVKHANYVMRQHGKRQSGVGEILDEAGYAAFAGSFTLAEGETLAGVVAEFDALAPVYLAEIAGLEPGDPMVAPPAPWDGIYEPVDSVRRFELVHQVEELARHAGHADIIREQIDGAQAASLLMALEGREGNDFVKPWAPAEG